MAPQQVSATCFPGEQQREERKLCPKEGFSHSVSLGRSSLAQLPASVPPFLHCKMCLASPVGCFCIICMLDLKATSCPQKGLTVYVLLHRPWKQAQNALSNKQAPTLHSKSSFHLQNQCLDLEKVLMPFLGLF